MSCLINIDSLLKLVLYGDDQIFIFSQVKRVGRTRFNSSTPKSYAMGSMEEVGQLVIFFFLVTMNEYFLDTQYH